MVSGLVFIVFCARAGHSCIGGGKVAERRGTGYAPQSLAAAVSSSTDVGLRVLVALGSLVTHDGTGVAEDGHPPCLSASDGMYGAQNTQTCIQTHILMSEPRAAKTDLTVQLIDLPPALFAKQSSGELGCMYSRPTTAGDASHCLLDDAQGFGRCGASLPRGVR